MSQKEITVAVTGAAGQIGYSLLFRLASGEVFGSKVKIKLALLELPQAIKAAEGVAMELDDCAFSCLSEINCFDEAKQAFDGANWALLVGSKPRQAGMERADLIRSNGPIFVGQGKALSKAASDIQVCVVGNPCNTNALIAMHNCRDIPAQRFAAMTALDENRAKALLAQKAQTSVESITQLAIWGNHSTTMYPDFENAKIAGQALEQVITDRTWLEEKFIPRVQKRGAEIIKARGQSSAASAASACLDHVRRMSQKSPSNTWFSAAIASDGQHYGVPKGLFFSFPLKTTQQGTYEVVSTVKLSEFAKKKLELTSKELLAEREVIKDLLA